MTDSNQASAKGADHVEEVSLADFIDASPVATFVINTEHVVTHFNKACESLLGVMNLVGPEKGQFNDDELRILYSVGNQVAVLVAYAIGGFWIALALTRKRFRG